MGVVDTMKSSGDVDAVKYPQIILVVDVVDS